MHTLELRAMLATLTQELNALLHRTCPNDDSQGIPDPQAGMAIAGAGELAILEGLTAGLLSLPMLLLLFSLL